MTNENFLLDLMQLLEIKTLDSAICIAIAPPYQNEHWHYCSLKQLLSLPFSQRYDLAVINVFNSEQTPTLTPTMFNVALVKLRDLWARQVIVLSPAIYASQLRALGFVRIVSQPTQEQEIEIWQFNIKHYKPVPDWLNAKFWANPELWNQYRW